MTDLEKEREAFENTFYVDGAVYDKKTGHYVAPTNTDDDGYEVEFQWNSWLQRAELAQAEINDLKQQIAELHASRVSWVEYSQKIESGEFVLVPRFLNEEKQDAINELIAESVYIETSWGGVNSVDWTQGLDKALHELILGVGEQP